MPPHSSKKTDQKNGLKMRNIFQDYIPKNSKENEDNQKMKGKRGIFCRIGSQKIDYKGQKRGSIDETGHSKKEQQSRMNMNKKGQEDR